MITKNCLKPGMLVEFRNGEIAIVAITNDILFIRKDLCISWNDNTGRCLYLENYSDDLTYPNHEQEFSIDKVYNVGSFHNPFSMDISSRQLLWDRYRSNFSFSEKSKAAFIKLFINQVDPYSIDSPILMCPLPNNKMEIKCGETSRFILPLNENFVNLDKVTNLDDIINGKVLQ